MTTETVNIVVNESGSVPAAQGIRGIGDAADKTQGQINSLNSTMNQFNTVLGVIGLALTANKVLEYAETYGNLIERLVLVSKTSQDLINVEQKLFDISNQTRQGFQGTVEVYSAFAKATASLHISQDDLLGVIKTLNQAMTISGKSSDEVGQAMRRLATSITQGTLDARGFTTILMQFPTLAVALAQGMNVSVEALKQMAAAGQIASQDLIRAFKQAAPAIEEAFARTTVSVSAAFTVLGNNVMRVIGQLDQARGTTQLLANAILLIAANANIVVPVILALTAAFTTFGLVIFATSGALTSMFTILMAHPFALIIAAIVLAIQLFIQFGNEIKLTSDGSVTALGAVVAILKMVGSAILSVVQFLINWFAPAVTLVYGVLKVLYEGLTQTESGMSLLKGAAIGVGIALSVIAIEAIPLVGIILGIAAAFLAAYAAMLYLRGGADLVKSKFTEMKEVASAALDGITAKMKESTTEMSKNGLAAKDWGNVFKDVGDQNVRTNDAIQKATKATAATTQQSFGQMSQAVEDTAVHYHNAFGQMISDTSDWARMTGQYFNNVQGQAAATGNAIGRMNSSLGGGGVNPSGYHPTMVNGSANLVGDWMSPGGSDASPGGYSRSGGISDLAQYIAAGYATGGQFMVGGHGGTDTQLVQFMATPGERITVETPQQQNQKEGNQPGSPINVAMHIHTTDANSFRENESQIMLRLNNRLRTVQNRLGSF